MSGDLLNTLSDSQLSQLLAIVADVLDLHARTGRHMQPVDAQKMATTIRHLAKLSAQYEDLARTVAATLLPQGAQSANVISLADAIARRQAPSSDGPGGAA